MFANPGLTELHERMAGLTGTKPFECTGTEEEVRAAIQAIGHMHPTSDLPALTTCLNSPAVTTARPLGALLTDWGNDGLMPPALKTRIRQATHHQHRP